MKALKVLMPVFLISLIFINACDEGISSQPDSNSPSIVLKAPSAPVNLIGHPDANGTVNLTWIDNSNNEDGFKVFRNNRLVATLKSDVTSFQDTGLETSMTYQYVIRAFNSVGESPIISCEIRIPNPPIEVILDRIGVADNGESFLRDDNGGEVFLGYIVIDGSHIEQGQLPTFEGHYYTLFDNEEMDVGIKLFSTSEVGASLRVAIIGYEDDGGAGEQLLYQGLSLAAESYMAGATSTLLDASGIGLGNLIGKLFGADDDWLGSYESAWTSDANWGIGKYSVDCKNKNGLTGLRLWFTIQNPSYPLEAAMPQSQVTVSTPETPQNTQTIPTTTIPPALSLVTVKPTTVAPQNVQILVNIISFQDTSNPGEGADLGGIGDPYFRIQVGTIEKISQKPVAEAVDYLNNPFSAIFDINDTLSSVPILIQVWDYDGGWSGDEQYDCSSASGSDTQGLSLMVVYNVSQNSMTYISDGGEDGSYKGPQARIKVEINTLCI